MPRHTPDEVGGACAPTLFTYYLPNGTAIDNGTLTADGTCAFLEASCSLVRDGGAPCCKIREPDSLSSAISGRGPLILMVAFPMLYWLRGLALRWWRKNVTRTPLLEVDARAMASPPPSPPPPSAAVTPDPFGRLCACLLNVLGVAGYVLALVLSVELPILMQRSIQQSLSPTHRSAVLAASAFLTPFEEVFIFLEDTMLVRINYAMGAGQTALVNELLNAGVCMGLLCGLVASVLASTLTISLRVFTPLVAPGGEMGDGACSLIQPAAHVAAAARGYFLLHAWQWPFVFVNKTLSGFFLGAGNFLMYGWPSVLRSAATLLIWFGGLDAGVDDKFTLLGLSAFAGPPISTAFFALGLALDRQLRAKWGLRVLGFGGPSGLCAGSFLGGAWRRPSLGGKRGGGGCTPTG